MGSTPSGRTRVPPQERFAPAEGEFDLEAASHALWNEANAGQHGHRQMALFRHGPATLALYCFEPGASLPDHAVDGPVIIQVLEGELIVRTEQNQHTLPAGRMLRLAPGVTHDVEARKRSRMLLTICVEGPASHGIP